MAKTLRVRTRTGWDTKPVADLPGNRLTAEEVDDNFLTMEDQALPTGGTAGQVPIKQSATSHDVAWGDVVSSGGTVYVQDTAPTSPSEGDFWYNSSNEDVYVYREISPSVFNWVAMILGDNDSDNLDGGLY